MMKAVLIVLTSVLFFSCKSSKHENKPLTAKEFLKLYKPLNLPVNIADSGLSSFGDTTTVSIETFIQFIPDSALQKIDVSEYRIHPAGIIHTKTLDYLLTKFESAKINKLVVFVLDDKHQYKSSLLLLSNDNNDDYRYSVSITNEPTFIIRREKQGTNKELLYSRNGYAYSASTNTFSVVLNDSNEDEKRNNEVINPIDTFALLNKYSGDYIKDEKNFISIRDGKNPHTYIFFIHFEKSKDCVGELKGQMNLIDQVNAIYQESGDPCVIHFKFSPNSIKIKEEGNCGNYRGITCLFDFTFKKKKPLKSKTVK